MKVAVFLGSGLQTLGGGFTFESEIFSTLIEFAENSKHSFVLCCEDNGSFLKALNGHQIEFISLHCNLPKRLLIEATGPLKAILKKQRNPHYPLRTKLEIKGWHEDWMVNKLVAKEVELIMYLTPHYIPIMDIPYITILWDLAHQIYPYFPEVSLIGEWEKREKFYKRALKRATTIITGTEVGKDEIEKFYQVPADRIKVLPFPTPQFALNACVFSNSNSFNILRKFNLPSEYLFYPAQFWPHKNHIAILRALKLLRDEYNLILPTVFVGSDKGNKSYVQQAVAEMGLVEQVHILGFVAREDLIALYQHAFALVFVSFFGPDNLPPLEAFALGCPVIASNVPGAKEQLGDAALLVDQKDFREIALAIRSLWEDKELVQMLKEKGVIRANKWKSKDYIKALFEILDDFESIRTCWISKKFDI